MSQSKAPMHSAGFTLVELLVALTILALVSLLSWRGLDGVVRARDAAGATQDRTFAVTAALDQMAIDLRNAAPVNVTLSSQTDGSAVLQFVRSLADPAGAQRDASVQWRLANQQLVRGTREGTAEEFSQPALANVQSFTVRAYINGQWIDAAQVAGSNAQGQGQAQGQAQAIGPVQGIAVVVGLNEGPVTRTFVVGGL
jgi:general secretion pathway protein J